MTLTTLTVAGITPRVAWAADNVVVSTNASGSKTWSFPWQDSAENTKGTDHDTGKVYPWTVPYSGTYRLETWGAQGGDPYDHAAGEGTVPGGRGGYACGEVDLKVGDVLYVAVGGAGEGMGQSGAWTWGSTVNGGWNGGGSAGLEVSSGDPAASRVGGGGGATHIATAPGELSELRATNSGSSSVLIVAGGGGGAGSWNHGGVKLENAGGAGGGLSGGNPSRTTYAGYTSGCGGTQEKAGTSGSDINAAGGKGKGGDSGSDRRVGGGSGWWGGGASRDYALGAGGGSGRVGGASTAVASDGAPYDGSTASIVRDGVTETLTIDSGALYAGTLSFADPETGERATGRTGDGYARITLLKPEAYTVTFDAGEGCVGASDGPTADYVVPLDDDGAAQALAACAELSDGEGGVALPSAWRRGYAFGGWYTAAEGGEAVTASTVPADHDADADMAVTFHAHWTAETTAVTLDADGFGAAASTVTTASVGTSSYTMTYASAGNATVAVPERPGYAFGGWWDGTDAGTATRVFGATGAADPEATAYWATAGGVSAWAWDPDATEGADNALALHAMWEAEESTLSLTGLSAVTSVAYTLNGASGTADVTSGAATLRYTVEDTIEVTGPQAAGHVFAGWTGATGTSGATQTVRRLTIAAGTVGDSAYAADLHEGTYTVTFDANGGSFGTDPETGADVTRVTQDVTYPGTASAPATAPVRDRHTLAGWTLAGVAYDFARPVAADITLKAAWDVRTYTYVLSTEPVEGHVTYVPSDGNWEVTGGEDPAPDGYWDAE